MSVAQTRAARRKMILRYRNPGYRKTVAEAIAEERRAAAREAARKATKKK